jgi:hypothetical protein
MLEFIQAALTLVMVAAMVALDHLVMVVDHFLAVAVVLVDTLVMVDMAVGKAQMLQQVLAVAVAEQIELLIALVDKAIVVVV